MNYRHAYHAGNHADVLKHAVLARLIEHMKKKDKPFRVIDAHAGIGVYDLARHRGGQDRRMGGRHRQAGRALRRRMSRRCWRPIAR